jgi:hypothetical protein
LPANECVRARHSGIWAPHFAHSLPFLRSLSGSTFLALMFHPRRELSNSESRLCTCAHRPKQAGRFAARTDLRLLCAFYCFQTKTRMALKAVPQGTLHAAALIEQGGVAAIAAGVAIRVVGDACWIETHRVGCVEDLPGELQFLLFSNREDLRNTGVDAEVSIAAVKVALSGFAGVGWANIGKCGCLTPECIGLAAAVVPVAA